MADRVGIRVTIGVSASETPEKETGSVSRMSITDILHKEEAESTTTEWRIRPLAAVFVKMY